ncbi:MAG TPA: phosphatase PAP2 family protein, partial [Reyranella sp.]|nr:phosphatase PAP2 family protein [Reyranella sp.]
LDAFDRWLHFGIAPWQWLPLELWPVTRFIEFIYALWGVALAAVPFVVCLRREDANRTRLLISYPLVMILFGNIVAAWFMSSGPFWFHHQAGMADPYAALFAYLQQVNPDRAFSAVLFQEYLWQAYQKDITEIGTAISAFPSIHVAIAALFLFYAWPISKAARAFALAFFLIILVGSVLLGWHYAVDGYAGFAGAAAIYWAVGRVLRIGRGPRPAEAGHTAAEGKAWAE